jgi:transcriptional regulator with XRE-family HTH domain
MDSKRIGTFIAQLRKEQGYTQTVLAEKLNISNRTISKWENGDGMPDITILPDLAKALGVTVDELLNAEKKEIADFKVTEIESKEKINNLFQIIYIISLFLAIFGSILGVVTEVYNIWAFDIIFYNHWEIVFVTLSLFSIVLSALCFSIGIIRLKLTYNKNEIVRIAGKRGFYLAVILSLMPISFIIRLFDVSRFGAYVEIFSFVITILFVLIVSLIWRKLYEKNH